MDTVVVCSASISSLFVPSLQWTLLMALLSFGCLLCGSFWISLRSCIKEILCCLVVNLPYCGWICKSNFTIFGLWVCSVLFQWNKDVQVRIVWFTMPINYWWEATKEIMWVFLWQLGSERQKLQILFLHDTQRHSSCRFVRTKTMDVKHSRLSGLLTDSWCDAPVWGQ